MHSLSRPDQVFAFESKAFSSRLSEIPFEIRRFSSNHKSHHHRRWCSCMKCTVILYIHCFLNEICPRSTLCFSTYLCVLSANRDDWLKISERCALGCAHFVTICVHCVWVCMRELGFKTNGALETTEKTSKVYHENMLLVGQLNWIPLPIYIYSFLIFVFN